MLIVLGIAQLRDRGVHGPGITRVARPLTIGILHGLAGSAGVALLATSTIASPLWALAYLAMFGVGTLAGMAVLTAALVWSLAWGGRRGGWLTILVRYLPGCCSLLVGLGLLADTLRGA
jgi:high-affinity nickel-transport protein